MTSLGLPGNAFIPMVVGFGCNVPAIMATRTMERPRDRIVAVLMSPFMNCGVRLAVYTVFAAALFPERGQFVLFGFYLGSAVLPDRNFRLASIRVGRMYLGRRDLLRRSRRGKFLVWRKADDDCCERRWGESLMLLELRDYLASHGWVCVRDVAAHFDISPQTAHAMLEHWVRKGKASRLERRRHSCTLPCAKSLAVYHWIESVERQSPPGSAPSEPPSRGHEYRH